jgi:hypothetical protein
MTDRRTESGEATIPARKGLGWFLPETPGVVRARLQKSCDYVDKYLQETEKDEENRKCKHELKAYIIARRINGDWLEKSAYIINSAVICLKNNSIVYD